MDYDKEFRHKDELVEYAESRGLSGEGTRAEITARLVAQDEINAAVKRDEARAVKESDQPAPIGGNVARDESDDPAAGVMTAESTKAKRVQRKRDEGDGTEAEEKDGRVLIKMTKPALAHTVGNYRFSRIHPFCLVDKETADMLTQELTGFRKATAAEAEQHYS